MHILLDLQGAQGRARRSGLGRYALEFARAVARAPGPHRVSALVSAREEEAGALAAEFADLLGGAGEVHLFSAPPGRAGAGRAPRGPERLIGERVRAAKVAETGCDLLLLGSVWEGYDDGCVTTWPADLARPATAAVLHDLIPLTHRAMYLDAGWRAEGRVPWFFRCLREAAECDLLLANSEATRAEALAHLGPAWGARVATVGGGVSPGFAHVPPDAGTLRRLRDRYGLPPGAVLFLGAGDYRKNHGALVAAHALLPEALRAAHPLAIGHERPWEVEAGPEVIRLPRIEESDLPAAYSSAAALCAPSLAEGFGLPILEAMACGCPALAGDAGAMPEVVGRGDALFDPRDPADMARVLRRALEDAGWRAELARWGLRRAREMTWDAVALRALDALERAVTPRRTDLRPRPRLAVVAARAEAAEAAASRLGGRYAATLATEAPHGDPEAARFPRLSWPSFLARPDAFDRVAGVGDLPPSFAAAAGGPPGGASPLADAPADAPPEALCEAIEAAHLRGRGAREGAARLLADLPLGDADLAAARAALDATWPEA